LLERVGARQPPVGDIGQSEGPRRAHQRDRPGGGHPPRARAEGRDAHLKSRDSNAAAARLRTQAEYTIAYAVARPRLRRVVVCAFAASVRMLNSGRLGTRLAAARRAAPRDAGSLAA